MRKIIDFTFQKDALFALKIRLEEVLKGLNKDETDCLEYKYFKRKPKEYFIGFDYESRGYFRKQIKLVKKIADKLSKDGADDKWFEDNCLTMDFFKELLKRVIEHENSSHKNKKKVKKQSQKRLDDKRLTA